MNFIPIASNAVQFRDSKYMDTKPELSDSAEATDLSIKLIKSDTDISTSCDELKFSRNRNSKSGNKKSFVWKYFAHPKSEDGVEDRSRTECIECKSQLAFNTSGTTTTMLNHLKSRHPTFAECEEWRKVKSEKLAKSENCFSMPQNNQSPSETLSPCLSFDFQKAVNSSPEAGAMNLFSGENNLFNNFTDQGQLMCLAKLLPQQLIVTSCLQNPAMDSNSTKATATIHSNISSCVVQGQQNGNGTYNGSIGHSCLDTNNNNNYYDNINRSIVKRKRKKPLCKQTTINNTNNECYEGSANKQMTKISSESSDIASFLNVNPVSLSNGINYLLGQTIAPNSPNTANNDCNNNSFPVPMRNSFPSLVIPASPRSPSAEKMGITESEKIIVYWLIKDLRPFSVLEEYGMKTLFSSLMPTVTIPNIMNLKSRILPSIYWTLKMELLNNISTQLGSAFSIELWDNPTSNGIYASVKLNFYSKTDFQLQSEMIATKEINAKFLCSDLLLNCCNDIGIDFSTIQFLPVVMNSPESMTDELANVGEIEQNKKIIIIPCLITSLQEVVKVGFQEPEILNLLDKCRALKELAGAYNLPCDRKDDPRNNVLLSSKYSSDKFKLIYWVYQNIDQIVDMLDCFNPERFSKDDEMFLKQLTPLLEHIYQTLSVIEQNKLTFSASMIKSIILTMNKSPFQPKDDDHPGVIQFKMAVKNRLNMIYPESGQLHDILSMATILDPRFKKFQDSGEEVMIQELRSKITNGNDVSPSSVFLQEPPHSIKREDLSTIFGDDCVAQEPKSEVDQYLNELKIDIEKSPIKWWHDNSLRFPTLSRIALKYLCIPLANQHGLASTETSSVQIYSRRKDIDPDHIDHYLFLHHNWK